MKAIEFKKVWEKYRVKYIKERKISWEEFWALEDVDFSVNKGEILGIIGKNGAGKTTILKLIAGMITPDKGQVAVKGRISALMELGAGFNPEFTGRENLFLNAQLYGIAEVELSKRMEAIVEFAQLGKFIDAPLKYYSQGMYARLGFSLAIHIDPDILLIDDILAVGDEQFQRRCRRKIFSLKEKGKTVVVVSHDTMMLKKLCDRALLLEKGKIVASGEPEEIVSRYLETIKEQGILKILGKDSLRLSQGPLSLFINPENKSLHLYHKGEEITRASGLEASFKCKGRLFNTFYSSKFIARKENSSLIIDIGWEEASLSQRWRLYLKDNCLQWEIEQNKELNQPIKELKIGLLLNSEYKRFFCGFQEDTFPEEFSVWQDMRLENPLSGSAGTMKTKNLPALSLENVQNSSFRIQNGDVLSKCRSLQIEIDNKLVGQERSDFSLRASIFEEETFIIKYIQSQLEHHKRSLSEQFSITSGPLRLFANHESRTLHLFYNHAEVTKGRGLFAGLKFNPDYYMLSFNFDNWKAEKINEQCLHLHLTNQGDKKQCIFSFQLTDDTLFVTLEIISPKEFHLYDYHLVLEVNENYKEWVSLYEQGSFDRERYSGNLVPARMTENKIDEIILKPGTDRLVPIKIASSFEPLKRIVSLYKDRAKEAGAERVCLQYRFANFKEDQLAPPGRYTIFEGEINAGSKTFIEEKQPFSGPEIKGGDLKFIFDRGKGKVFWKNKELTKGLGVYSSLRTDRIWHDSSQAIWKVEGASPSRLVLYGKWFSLPLYQRWIVELRADTIEWGIETEAFGPIEDPIEQANLMIGNDYTDWSLSNGVKGKFNDFYSEDYDILPFRYCYLELAEPEIKAASRDLPSISFYCATGDNLKVLVENSDSCYKARLMQYQKTNRVFPAPKYQFFKGAIKIEEKG